MFNFQRIINKLLETPIAQFVSGYCVHARHQGHDCRVCVDNCPGKAIVMDGRVRFNEDRCLGCGACAATCPTGAFVLERPSRRELLERLEGRRAIVLTCHQGDKSPDMIDIPCLAYLDSQVLVAMALRGTKVYLDLSQERCSTCRGRGAGLALAALGKANRILQALGEEENAGTIGRVIEAEVELMARDEFLVLCRKKIGTELKKSVASLWESQDTGRGQKPDEGVNRGVPRDIALPEQRRLLLEALSKKVYQRGEKLVEVEGLPFGGVAIGDKCIGCGDCTVFCPTGALKKSVQEGNIAITHRPAQCLKCGLCALGCRVKALEYSRTLDLDQVLSGEEIKVFQLAVKRCTECATEITLRSESGLCYSCQTKKEMESELDKVFANELK